MGTEKQRSTTIVQHRDPLLRLAHYHEIPGTNYGTPKEIWGFRLAARGGAPKSVGLAALAANADLLRLDGVCVQHRKVKPSCGAWHVIFNQQHLDRRIHRAYVTVHMNREHEVYLIKNRAVPVAKLPRRINKQITMDRARAIARQSAERGKQRSILMEREELWFALRSRLRLAYKFRFRTWRPLHEWIIYVDARSGSILSKYDNAAALSGRARVFDPNPVVALGDWRPLLDGDDPVRRVPASTYERATLRGIGRSGFLSGPHVSTRLTRKRLRRPHLDFQLTRHEHGFEEVMVYFHVDRAVRYVESLGYRGARSVFTDPIPANACATREDNSFYTPGDKSLGFGRGPVDDAEDGETILHEFGHALQDAICPDFGQSTQASAMGEGFGDYFAASFFAGKKIARHARVLLPTVMTWDGITMPDDDVNRPPCVRRLDSSLTFESFNHSPTADEHDNGEIWSATLWDIWDAVGRSVADRIIIESHFQLDGFTSFARGARAIVDADRNLFAGRHTAALKRIFRRRGIGPVD